MNYPGSEDDLRVLIIYKTMYLELSEILTISSILLAAFGLFANFIQITIDEAKEFAELFLHEMRKHESQKE